MTGNMATQRIDHDVPEFFRPPFRASIIPLAR
jgi:hypothetical protein